DGVAEGGDACAADGDAQGLVDCAGGDTAQAGDFGIDVEVEVEQLFPERVADVARAVRLGDEAFNLGGEIGEDVDVGAADADGDGGFDRRTVEEALHVETRAGIGGEFLADGFEFGVAAFGFPVVKAG